MAGLFGGAKAGAAGKGKKFDWGDAALGFFGVPAKDLIQRKQKQREAEAAAAQQAQVEGMIDNDPALSTPEAKLYAKANPKAYIEAYMSRFQSRQFGAGGGSIYTPGANGGQWQMAPSRHEFQGSVYDVGGGTPGQKAPVTPQHEGTQWVTPQTGTRAFPVNSFSGGRRDQGEAAGAAPFQPGEVVNGYRFKGGDDTDPANWEPVAQGGAGPSVPRTFPF